MICRFFKFGFVANSHSLTSNPNPHPVLNPYQIFNDPTSSWKWPWRATSNIIGDGCGEGSSSSSGRLFRCEQDRIDPHWWSSFTWGSVHARTTSAKPWTDPPAIGRSLTTMHVYGRFFEFFRVPTSTSYTSRSRALLVGRSPARPFAPNEGVVATSRPGQAAMNHSWWISVSRAVGRPVRPFCTRGDRGGCTVFVVG
jgi:hypothetical protein